MRNRELILPDLELIKAEQARRDFRLFIPYCWHVLEPGEQFCPGWHIDCMAEHLVAVFRGEIRNLLINIPPRHCKSILLAVMWHAWCWLQSPYLKFVYSSYSMEFSLRDSFKTLSFIQSPWFQYRYGHIFQLNKKKQNPTMFLNDKNGYRFSTSVDAGATGEGGDFIVCFTSETKIKVKFGELPIGTIVENKLKLSVLSFNILKNKTEYARVLSHFKRETDKFTEINYGNHQILFCTENHPIFVLGKGFIEAFRLQKNDVLYGEDGQQVFVNYITPVIMSKQTAVYNLEVEGNNNYFAGGVLVHNCDDAHNTREAESKAKLESTKRWWFEAMGSRGNDPKRSARIVQGQRQSDLDVYAEIIRRGYYEHLCLPGEFDNVKRKTTLGYFDKREKEGELLWPNRFGAEEMAELRLVLGPYAYAAQVQQNPTPRGGAIIKTEWLQYYELKKDAYGYIIAPTFIAIFQSWDTAFKEGEENDYSVCQTWGIAKNGYYLINQFRDKIQYPTLLKTAIMLYNTYSPELAMVEDKGSGTVLLQALNADTRLKFVGINPGRSDKVERLSSVSGFFEASKVFVPRGEPWLADYIAELTKFPFAEHDDQVDSTTQFLIHKGLPHLKQSCVAPSINVMGR